MKTTIPFHSIHSSFGCNRFEIIPDFTGYQFVRLDILGTMALSSSALSCKGSLMSEVQLPSSALIIAVPPIYGIVIVRFMKRAFTGSNKPCNDINWYHD